MRKLKFNDTFTMSRILKKMNLKIDAEGKSQEQVGAEFILTIAENAHLAEKEVNAFMGSLTEMSAEEFGDLPIDEALNYFNEFRNMPGVSNFFKLAGQLTK